MTFFLLTRDADGDTLPPLFAGGGCDSRSNSADEATSLALSELASPSPSPAAAFDDEAAPSVLSADAAEAFAADDNACVRGE